MAIFKAEKIEDSACKCPLCNAAHQAVGKQLILSQHLR